MKVKISSETSISIREAEIKVSVNMLGWTDYGGTVILTVLI